MSAERQARYRARLKAKIDALHKAAAPDSAELERLRQRIRELEADAKAAKPGPPKLGEVLFENDQLHATIERLEHQLAKAKAAKPKAAKAPVDPDSEVAKLKKRIAVLNAKVLDFRQAYDTLQQETGKAMEQAGAIPFEVSRAVAKGLTEATTSPKTRLAALQMWNALGINKRRR